MSVDARHSGQRLDNFLVTLLKGVPKTRVYRMVRRGEVRVNQGRVGPDYRLCEGDVVRVPPVRRRPAAAGPQPERFAWLCDRILHEDDAFIVLDKPAGLAVHGGTGIDAGVIEGLRAVRQNDTLELVHRLDRETSGCLLIARTRLALEAFHHGLRQGAVSKEYLALVAGRWSGPARWVDLPLARVRLAPTERKTRPDAGGKPSATHFAVEQRYRDATLMRLALATGRTHQARAHAAAIGFPIAGDRHYGDRAWNDALRSLGLRRVFLHAAALSFTHPTTGRPFRIEAPLSPELSSLMAVLP